MNDVKKVFFALRKLPILNIIFTGLIYQIRANYNMDG